MNKIIKINVRQSLLRVKTTASWHASNTDPIATRPVENDELFDHLFITTKKKQ